MTTFEKKKNYFEPFLGLKNRRTLLLPNISGCPRLLEWHPLDLMFKEPIEDSFAKKPPAYLFKVTQKLALFPWIINKIYVHTMKFLVP